jgi:hypothetical protein
MAMKRFATADLMPETAKTAAPVARLYPNLPWTVELELRQAAAQQHRSSPVEAAAIAPARHETPSSHPLHAEFSPSWAIGTQPAGAPMMVARRHPELPWSVESEWRQPDFLPSEAAEIPWLKDIRDEARNEVELPSTPPATLTPWTDPARADPLGGTERGKSAPRRPLGRSIA